MEYGRLSKLQKWILEKCYEQGEEKTYFISRRQLVRKYCEEVKGRIYSISSVQVSVTRSIRTLAFKEYIFVYGSEEKPGIDYTRVFSKEQKMGFGVVGDNIKFLCLSDEGIAKVEKLLNVKK